MSTGCWGKNKSQWEEGVEDIRMGVKGPKRQAYDKGKIRQRSRLVSSCSSCAVSQRKELFLTDVSEPAVMGPFSIRRVLPLKLKGVEGSRQRGVRNWVLHASGFGAALSCGGVGLEDCMIGNTSAGWGWLLHGILLRGERVRVHGEGPRLWGAPRRGAVAKRRQASIKPSSAMKHEEVLL